MAPFPRGARLLAVRVERDDVGERFARGDPELDARVERDLRAGADGRARLEYSPEFRQEHARVTLLRTLKAPERWVTAPSATFLRRPSELATHGAPLPFNATSQRWRAQRSVCSGTWHGLRGRSRPFSTCRRFSPFTIYEACRTASSRRAAGRAPAAAPRLGGDFPAPAPCPRRRRDLATLPRRRRAIFANEPPPVFAT